MVEESIFRREGQEISFATDIRVENMNTGDPILDEARPSRFALCAAASGSSDRRKREDDLENRENLPEKSGVNDA